jgi:hypothetical protein
MWTLGLPGGPWPLACWACPVRAAGATPLIKSFLTYAYGETEVLSLKTQLNFTGQNPAPVACVRVRGRPD